MAAARSNPGAWTGLEPAGGRLLVAAPMLTEATFARTVIYLLEHDETGTVGVVLNRASHTPVGQVLPEWETVVSEPQVVFSGGSVQPDGALCLGVPIRASGATRPLGDGMCTVDLDGDVMEVHHATSKLRIFAGHSGWAAGQLAQELAEGAWFVVEGAIADVFAEEPAGLWRIVLRRQPPPLRFISTFPMDPVLN
jgi:putative transcriptional regulator